MIRSEKTRFILRISVFYLLLTDASCSWNLTSLNISNDVLIWRFAMWRNRVFLAIPRSTNEKEKEWKPTLVEVSWLEINSNLPLSVANAIIFPKLFPKEGSSKNNYETLVSVTGLDVDARGRLWVLDAFDGYKRWPRIVIYDLKRNDRMADYKYVDAKVYLLSILEKMGPKCQQIAPLILKNVTQRIFVGKELAINNNAFGIDIFVSSTELTKVSSKQLRSLVIDLFEDQWGFRGYIADAGDETIIVYSSGLRKWWKLRMLHGPEIPRVESTDLAVSRRNSILYMTGHNTHDLFSINLETIRTEVLWTLPSRGMQNVTVTWLGKKLGSSVGLFSDLKDGLHYFMTSERASVRWDTKLPLNAQSHSVLVQNDDVPCITDYIMDARRNIWGLVNSKCPIATKENISSNSTLKSRTVRILKYSFTMQ